MTVVILDRGADAPYAEWLAGHDVVLVTDRPTDRTTDALGYAEVRHVPDPQSAELAVLELAATTELSALVATATPDLVRAGALRDHLGIPGQSRADATVFADPVATRRHLQAAGVAALPAGAVLRVSDLYWLRHRWGGGALRVRRRKVAGWPTAAVLRTDADLRAFTANGLAPSLISTPSLFAEPHHDGELCVADRGAATVLAALPTIPGHPYRVHVRHTETGDWLVDTVDPAPRSPADHRAAVLAQAGLAQHAEEAT